MVAIDANPPFLPAVQATFGGTPVSFYADFTGETLHACSDVELNAAEVERVLEAHDIDAVLREWNDRRPRPMRYGLQGELVDGDFVLARVWDIRAGEAVATHRAMELANAMALVWVGEGVEAVGSGVAVEADADVEDADDAEDAGEAVDAED